MYPVYLNVSSVEKDYLTSIQFISMTGYWLVKFILTLKTQQIGIYTAEASLKESFMLLNSKLRNQKPVRSKYVIGNFF